MILWFPEKARIKNKIFAGGVKQITKMSGCKAEEKEDCKFEERKSTEGSNNVVVDLVEFAMRVVHEELAFFFEEHCDLWDYGEDELKAISSGGGESLEQHDVYRKYVELVTSHLDDFVESSGLGSQREVTEAVEEAIQADKDQRKKLMAEIHKAFELMKKGGGAKDDAENKKPPPLLLFSQPIGLEFLLDSVLKLSEYETMRSLMIMKVNEKRMAREISKKAQKRRQEAARRRDLLDGGNSNDIESVFGDLKTRMQRQLPLMITDEEEDSMRCDATERYPRPSTYQFAVDRLVQVTSFASSNLSAKLESDAKTLAEKDDASHADWLNLLHDTLDDMCDEIDARFTATTRHVKSMRGNPRPIAESKD